MTNSINGRCDCKLGRHHSPECKNYIDVWRICPCPECVLMRRLEGVPRYGDDV